MAVRLSPVKTLRDAPIAEIMKFISGRIANESDDVKNAFAQLKLDYRTVTDEFVAAFNEVLGDDTLRLVIVPPMNGDDAV